MFGGPPPPTPPGQAPPPAQWAQPAAPPKKRMSTTVKVVIVVVVVVVILAIAGLALVGYAAMSSTVTIAGTDVGYDYTGTTSDYLTLNTTTSYCASSVLGGSTFTCQIALISTALLYTHDIDDFTAGAPFSVTGVSPTLPFAMGAGGTATFTVSVTAPSGSGTYTLSLTVTTN